MGKSVPSKVPNITDKALGTLGVIVDLLENVTGNDVYYCNSCKHRIILDKRSQPPLVCKKCGEEFDWDNLNKRKVKACQTCNKEYRLDDEYCEDHVPAVKLQDR